MMRLLMIAVLAFTSAAWAASPEQDYFAARDQYVKKLERFARRNPSETALDKARERALADLEKRLRRIVGSVVFKGLAKGEFVAKGEIDRGAINMGGLGAHRDYLDLEGLGLKGRLDGLVFVGDRGFGQIVVTTDSLFHSWLRDPDRWWKDKQKTPPDADSALLDEGFYTDAIPSESSNHHYYDSWAKYAEIPIGKPAGASFASAQLGQWGTASSPRWEVIVALRQDGKIFLANGLAESNIGNIPACDKVLKDSKDRAETAVDVARGATRDPNKSAAEVDAKVHDFLEERQRVLERGQADFHACFNERAPREAFFADLKREAQALADRISKR
ncbi:MAG: hypothetical protein ACT4O2_05485 [Beijerinckiaceae bacterium]